MIPLLTTNAVDTGILDGTVGMIFTYTGALINPLGPNPEDIHIEDIAHSLANQCRFTGHVREFYSTAQHCVLVSYIVPDEYKLWGLLHDASEAYLADIARPVKHQTTFPEFGEVYRKFESGLMDAVCVAFGLSTPEPHEVKTADNVLLWTEVRDLMPQDPPSDAEMLDTEILPWTPRDAERSFIARYNALTRPSLP